MRILHTSDWHLGRTFFGVDLHDHQARFLDHLHATAVDQSVDAILVAGDVYDRAIPNPEALELFDDITSRLRSAGIALIATSGNHDSFARLGIGRRLLDSAGLHIRARLSDITWPVRLESDRSPGVVVYGIPYLEPGLVHARMGVDRSHEAVLAAAMDRIRRHAEHSFPGVPLIVMAHAFVHGGHESESERDISVGGVGAVSADVFDGAAYTALGHLHRPQTISHAVRYSGSPLPYSFPEAEHEKSMILIDMDGAGPQISALPLPQFAHVETVRGEFEQVLASAGDLAGALVAVELSDERRVPDALARLKQVLPGLIRLSYPKAAPLTELTRSGPAAHTRTDTEIFDQFVSDVTGIPATDGQRRRFETALAQALREDA